MNFRNWISRFFRQPFFSPAALFPEMGSVSFLAGTMLFEDYPFAPSLAFQSGEIPAADILAVYADDFPAVVEVGGELLFVSKDRREGLLEFARAHKIPQKQRYDVWADLLDPYLDMEFTPEEEAHRAKRLLAHGFSGEKVDAIRQEVGKQMMKYNFDTMLWEWVHLGLYDVLSAMQVKYNKADFEDFYHRAMAIALTPEAKPALPPQEEQLGR